jgi:rSAM/selenodomain-associated transferase 1
MSADTSPPPRPVLQILAKEPRPGEVKTRLTPALTPDEAATVYRALAQRAFALARAAYAAGTVARIELWCTPSADSPYFEDVAGTSGFARLPQGDGDLGARMARATARALRAGERVLLIGTDCPSLTHSVLDAAARALTDADAVFVPASDGGYVLVGLARELDAFAGVRWSSPHVMADTRDRLRRAGVRWVELEPLDDVDTVADLDAWLARDPAAAAELPALRPGAAHAPPRPTGTPVIHATDR